MANFDYSVYKSKRVVVTGGAGFIGSYLCEELVKQGALVLSVDNYSAGKEKNIALLKAFKNFSSVNADVCDRKAMEKALDGAEIVFHNAASKKNICDKDPHRDLEVNGGGTLNLLEIARDRKIKKFVHASTGSVYGEPKIFPSDEAHPLRPVSYYGVSKLAGERYVDVFHHLFGLNTTILRYFHVYGPRQEFNDFGGVVSIFINKIVTGKDIVVFGDGAQVRSFTWVKDLVTANLRAAISPKTEGKVYNAASGIKVTINDLADNLLKYFGAGYKSKIVHGAPLLGDIMLFDISNKAITKDLEMEFEKDFWGTMKSSIEEFKGYIGNK